MRAIVTGLLLLASIPLLADRPQPATTNNNDSCDIAVLPAATLLLPYFEVDTAAAQGAGTTTLFTITNTSRYPQIAHVTVGTDWAFAVLSFNLFLTGYDVQGINLFDVIVRGVIAAAVPSGTSITTVPGSPQPASSTIGATPLSNTSNPNFVTSGPFDVSTTCAALPGSYDVSLNIAVKNALTVGTGYDAGGVNCGSSSVGSNTGTRAKGYVTVDVVSYCSSQFPTDKDGSYFSGPTSPLLFDNVLLGDYQQLGPTPAGSGTASTFDAEGNRMVHIRAVPEGGLSGASLGLPVETNLPFTFYDRYTPVLTRAADRRQPLPSVWTSRYIQQGPGSFATDLKIWREGITAGLPNCSGSNAAQLNSSIELTDIIRFDEHAGRVDGLGGPPPVCHPVLSAQRAGFGSCSDAAVGSSGSRGTSQNWVITSMFGAVGTNRLSVDFDASALGNGCTPAPALGAIIAPATQRNGLVCPNNAPPSSCSPALRPPTPNP